MKTLLIVAHAPSENTERLCQAAINAASHTDIEINVVCKSPIETIADDVLQADGLVLGTIENLSYMSGLTKDFFDRCYYPLLDKKQGLPMVAYIRAGHDGTGTIKALEVVTTGLRWQWAQPPLVLKGEWQDKFIKQVEELVMAIAVGVECGLY